MAQLGGSNIDLSKVVISRVDIVTGGDHGQGAFQAGCQVVIVFSEEDDRPSIVFDTAFAEVICRKDNTEVLKAKIEPHLTSGFKAICEKSLPSGLNGDGDIACSFGGGNDFTQKITPTKDVYVVGDLDFYAMVLVQEHSSGYHCYLCRISLKEFLKCHKSGEQWKFDLMNEHVSDMLKDGKAIEG